MGHLQRRNQKIKSLFSFQHQTLPFSSLQKKIQTALIFSASNPTHFHLLSIKPNPLPSSQHQTQPASIFSASNPTRSYPFSIKHNPLSSPQNKTQPVLIASVPILVYTFLRSNPHLKISSLLHLAFIFQIYKCWSKPLDQHVVEYLHQRGDPLFDRRCRADQLGDVGELCGP